MLFNSQQFVVFFAIVYSLYLLARDRVQQNIIILVASYVFYAWAAPRYLVLLIFYTLATFGIAIGIDRATTPLWRRAYLIAGIAVNLGVLGYFKYANFFITEVSAFLVHLKRSARQREFCGSRRRGKRLKPLSVADNSGRSLQFPSCRIFGIEDRQRDLQPRSSG
jgi:D-alanyl-lipoteichoic acid acyltransferase DltB (MBOAT superfamily)